MRSKKPILNNYVYSIYKNGKMRERRLSRSNDSQLRVLSIDLIFIRLVKKS